jgi:plasmid stabilization system protein ParE
MTSTSIRTGRGARQTLPGGTRDAGTQALQAAGRELLAAVGNQVLKVAVDRAVLKVDQVAARLDTIAADGTPRSAPTRKPPPRPTDSGGQPPEHRRHQAAAGLNTVAAGGGTTPPSAPSRKPPARPTDSGEQRPEHPTRVKRGAAVSFVVRQAMHLLRLIQRLAQRLLGALTRLRRRLQKVLGVLVHRGVAAARQTVDRLREKLKGAISRGGVVTGAAEHPMRVKTRAAVSFVVRQAMHLLRLIQRLAQRLLAALMRLLRRLQKVLGVLVHRGVAAARQTVDRLCEKLKGATSRGGVVMGAAAGLLKALGAGTNPVWGAVKGAIGGLSTKTKVLIVLALVLGLLLGPVVLVVVLLALLVFAVVAAVRTRAPT